MISKIKANLYDKYTKTYPQHHIKIAKEIAKVAKIKKQDHILEIGVGTGMSTQVFLNCLGKEGVLDGIEISRNMIYFFKKNIMSNNIGRVINGDAKNIAKYFVNKKYDKILCSNSFFWIKDINKFLKGVSKLLKKDSRFIFSIYGTSILEYSPKRIKYILQSVGMDHKKNESKVIFVDRPKEAHEEYLKIIGPGFNPNNFKFNPNNISDRVAKSKKIWQSFGLNPNKFHRSTPVMIYSAALI